MIQEFNQTTIQDIIVDSGLPNFDGVRTMSVSIRKPDTSIITKNLTDDDFYPKTKKIRITTTNTDLDLEGIYDYQCIDTTTPKNMIGKVLQFSVRKKIN